MSTSIDRELSFNHKALNLRAYRQELLASNIANADTPNYKARDFDFSAALANVLAGSSVGDVRMDRTSAGHLDATGGGIPGVRLQFRGERQGAVDGNTVDMDIERGAFVENSVQTEALLTFIREQTKIMNLALQS